MFEDVKIGWSTFWANFSWESWVTYLNGPIARAAFLVPIIGYLILFNDFIAGYLEFTNITQAQGVISTDTNYFLNKGDRLKLVYFGLITLAFSTVYFYWKRPHVIKQGRSLDKYMDFGLTYFTVYDFTQMHYAIQHEGHTSVYGKYYTDDWEAFLDDARWSESGAKETQILGPKGKRENRDHVSFSEAKKTHEDLLRSLLIDTYKRETMKRRVALVACIAWASIGYALLLIPSADLFLKVVESTFKPT